MIEPNFSMRDDNVWTFLYRHAFLSKRYKLLYVATPKVACTSLKWWFAGLEGYSDALSKARDSKESDPHLTIHDTFPKIAPELTGLQPESLLKPLESDAYFRFAVVRNPYKRLFSAWQSKLLLREPLQVKEYIDKDFIRMPVDTWEDIASAFEAFIEYLAENEAEAYKNDHWMPQVTLLRPGVVEYTRIAQIENTKELSEELTRHLGSHVANPFTHTHFNESLIPYSPSFITERAASLIRTLYNKDFQSFGYHEALPVAKTEFSSSQLEVALQAVRLIRGRHQRLEETRTVLTGEIASLTSTISAKEQHIEDLAQRIDGLSFDISAQEEQLCDLTEALSNQKKIAAEVEKRAQTQEKLAAGYKADADRLYAEYCRVLGSRSWRLTMPLRLVFRFLRSRGLAKDDRLVILEIARLIGRKLPLPLSYRAKLRSVAFRALGGAETSSMAQAPAVSTGAYTGVIARRYRVNSFSPRPMRAGCCALEAGMVSVILPVYNQASMLKDAIESVLNQTYENFELIVLNDGSRDNVESLLAQYLNDPRVRLYTQANQKLPKALSNAFDQARGEFWTWTSADNLMEPRQLEKLVERLVENPGVGMVYADYYAIDDRGQLLADPCWRTHNRPDLLSGEVRLPRDTRFLNVVQDNFIGACFLYRGWIGRVLGEYDPVQGVEDYDYWMRVNALFSIEHLGTDDLLYRYRVHDNTLNARAVNEKIPDKVQALMHYEAERAKFYEERVIFYADESAALWLEYAGLPRQEIKVIEATEFVQRVEGSRILVIPAGMLYQFDNLLHQELHIPLVVIFNDENVTPYEVAPYLRRRGVLAVTSDERTAWRIRLVSQVPVVDGDSTEVLAAVTAFAKNWLFYERTKDMACRERTAPIPFSVQEYRTNVLLQVDDFVQGGMENVVIDLACTVAKEGFRPRILVLGKGGDAVRRAKEAGLPVDVFDGGLTISAYRDYIIRHDIGLVNAHYSVYGCKTAYDMGIPFVQTIHNSYVWLDPVTIEQYREVDEYTTCYTCVSVAAAKYSDCVLNLDVRKFVEIPNGIDVGIFDGLNEFADRDQMRSAWGVEAMDAVFLNVASILPTKAQLPLVKAFSRVVERRPNSLLVLLGGTMEAAYERQVREFIKSDGLEGNVIFAGYEREVGPYYYAADIFVLPSFWEGWSLSFAEALYVGMPIVATTVGAAREFENIENVVLLDPPFGDITNLSYRNLDQYIYKDDQSFIARLADCMNRAAELKNEHLAPPMRRQLERDTAYTSYSALYRSI